MKGTALLTTCQSHTVTAMLYTLGGERGYEVAVHETGRGERGVGVRP